MTSKKPPHKENIFLSFLFNVILPVFILQKGAKYAGEFEGASQIALVVALALPLVYGLNDYIKTRHKNPISILGFISILLTGAFAFAKLGGHWFAIKEAALPLILGIAVLISIRMKKPLMEFLILKSGAFNSDLLKQKITENQNETAFQKQLNRSTFFLSISLFLSSLLNYVLARLIFKPISTTLSPEQQNQLLNDQIAEMNWKGWVVISAPLMIFLAFILWDFFKQIKVLTGLSLEELAQN